MKANVATKAILIIRNAQKTRTSRVLRSVGGLIRSLMAL